MSIALPSHEEESASSDTDDAFYDDVDAFEDALRRTMLREGRIVDW